MKRPLRTLALLVLAIALLAILFHNALLGAAGSFLVKTDALEKSDAAIILAGDAYGDRIKKGGDLVRQGYVPFAFVSGPSGNYGHYECDLAIPFAVNAGYKESYFVHAEHDARSTLGEAQVMLLFVRHMGAKTVILVTSDYHTRRAAKIFRAAAPDLKFIAVAATGQEFSAQAWWRNRQGRKIALNEWMKTIAEWFGI